jgi:hypothetical protein
VNSKFDWQPQAIKASLPGHLAPPSPAAYPDNRYNKQQQVRQSTRVKDTSPQAPCCANDSIIMSSQESHLLRVHVQRLSMCSVQMFDFISTAAALCVVYLYCPCLRRSAQNAPCSCPCFCCLP